MTSELLSFYRLRFDLAGGWHARIVRITGFARVAELADAYGSGPYGETRGGSSPLASSLLVYPRQPYLKAKAIGNPPLPLVLLDYLRPEAFRRAAQRAFINCESLLRPAACESTFLC